MGHEKLHSSEHTFGQPDAISPANIGQYGVPPLDSGGKISAGIVPDTTPIEGTAIKSTGELGATKFLREDGDGTSSWQTPSGVDITALHKATAAEISALTDKATPVDADVILGENSAGAAWTKIKLSWTNIKATLKTYFDTLYAAATHYHAGADITSGSVDGDRLPALSTSKKGAAPATGTPSGKFLKDDNTWASVTATDADAIHDNVAGEIHAITNKAAPVGADEIVIEDSAGAAWTKARAALSSLLTYFKRQTIQQFGGALVAGAVNTTGSIFCRLYFAGTTKMGTPTKVYAYCYSDGSSYDITLYDQTNSQTIATLNGQTNTVGALLDLGTLSNLPTGQAILRIELKKTSGGGTIAVANAGGIVEW